MALSEHESRVLKELEDDLIAGDPRLARVLGPRRGRWLFARSMQGVAVMGLGLGLLLGAVALQAVPVGVFAFLVLTVGAYRAVPPLSIYRFWPRRHRKRDGTRSNSEP